MRVVSYGAVWRHSLNCNEPGQSGSREGRRQSEAVPLHKLLAVIWALALIPAWIILFGRKQVKPRILWISEMFLAYGILYRIVLPEIYKLLLAVSLVSYSSPAWIILFGMKQVKTAISALALSEEARQLGNMGKVLCSKQAFPGWLSRWQDKKLMKNENVLQNFLAGLAEDQREKNIVPLDKRPQKNWQFFCILYFKAI